MKDDKFLNLILKELQEYREKEKRLYGWVVGIGRRTSYQRLLYSGPENGLSPQTIRDNISELSYNMTLYVRHGEPEVMGNTRMKVDPSRPLVPQISEAISSALVVDNPPWDLVSPGEKLAEIPLVDPVLKSDPAGATDRLVAEADAVCRSLEGVNVNYAELFVNYSRSLKVTSTGLVLPFESSDIYFEIAMEKLPLPNRQEIHNNRSAVTLEGLRIGEFIRQAAEETKLLGKVEVPATTSEAVILVHHDVINKLFHTLISQLDVSREYMHRPCFSRGAGVYTGSLAGDTDKINLKLDPALPFMAESTPFTGDGMKARAGEVIQDSTVRERFVSNRMAQYLDYPVNPVCGNIILTTGSRTYEQLIKQAPRVVEIITFSSLLLNDDLLTFSSEIKLAREYDNESGNVRYLKGGVVSGNIKEILASCQFSDRMIKHNVTASVFENPMGYHGPEYMLMRSGVAIAGV